MAAVQKKRRKVSRKKLMIGVVMDPLEKVRPALDSSLVIMAEACSRGHEVYYLQDRDLTVRQGVLYAEVTRMLVTREAPHFFPKTKKTLAAEKFDVVIIRKDPPFDDSYLYLTQLLDLIADEVLIVNHPTGIRTVNEKLFILNFPELIPPTLVTYSLEEARRFQKHLVGRKFDGRLIIKPLHLFGGLGIQSWDPSRDAERSLATIFSEMSHEGKVPLMLQPFLHIERGDKRLMLIDGKPAGTLLRLPREGEFLANLAYGGKAVKTEITAHDRKIAKTIAPRLRAEGIHLAGLDVLDGYLTEINVTSPTGFQMIEHLSGVALQSKLLDFIESKVKT